MKLSKHELKTKRLSSVKRIIIAEKLLFCLCALIVLMIFAKPSAAQQLSESKSQTHKVVSFKSKDEAAQLNKANALNSAPLIATKAVTRSQIKQQKLQLPASKKSETHTKSSGIYHEFEIYRAFVKLMYDDDNDGFYNTFSVTFDADVYSNVAPAQAVVYAEIYIRSNTNEWFHFHTTDNFTIFGDSSDDEFEVLAELSQGYSPKHYDILIDLYEPGYADIVATLSSDETNNLYALPLESVDYEHDEYYEVHEHGGSFGIALVGLMVFAGLFRIRKR